MFVLVCTLAVAPAARAGGDDMFSMMFRMMLTMMNVMSDAMSDNDNDRGWGGGNWADNFGLGNAFNVGMGTLPFSAGLGSPFTAFGYSPFNTFGMSPSSGFSPWSGMSPWSLGGNPWSSMSPWSSSGSPWSGLSPWSSTGSPWSGRTGAGYPGPWPGTMAAPFGNTGRGYPSNSGTLAPGYWNRDGLATVSLLEGRWYGNSGEILEIHGNRFQLRQGRVTLNGVITLQNDVVTLFSPQTRTTTRYTFMRNQSGLLLQDATGRLLRFTNRPVNDAMRIF